MFIRHHWFGMPCYLPVACTLVLGASASIEPYNLVNCRGTRIWFSSLTSDLSVMSTMLKLSVPPSVPKDVLTQTSTHWNPRASVHRVAESQPSVPVNLTWNWQERKQSQIWERISWDSEYLSDGRIDKLCRYYSRQKNIKCKRIVKERIDRISRCTNRQNRLWTADRVCMTRSKLRMCNSDDVS